MTPPGVPEMQRSQLSDGGPHHSAGTTRNTSSRLRVGPLAAQMVTHLRPTASLTKSSRYECLVILETTSKLTDNSACHPHSTAGAM